MDPATAYLVAKEQTFWMALGGVAAVMIGCLTVIVNGLGLYFLWGQLKANREAITASTMGAIAAAEAARIAQLTSRPWVKFEIDSGHLRLMPETPNAMDAQISIIYENIGQTPAIQAGIIFKPLIVVQGAEPDITAEFAALLETTPYGPETLFPGDKRRYGLNLTFPLPALGADEDIRFRLIAAVVYRAHATGDLLYTPLAMRMLRNIDGGAVPDFRPGMGSVQCRVRPMGTTLAPK